MISCIVLFMLMPHIYVTAQENEPPQFPEWMIEKRLQTLNLKTPIQLDYNEIVQAYIDVYTVKRREHLGNIISRSELYFPLFEEYLNKYNLPLELKYLAVIESALDPRAKSKSGAKGLWQFLYHTGSMLDLDVDTYKDERSDPLLSTDAACRYLEYLYRIFNDWQLVLAAYNGGPGEVQKAMIRSGGKTNYWELRPFMSAQVKGYVPAFIAAYYSMEYHSNYEIEVPKPKYDFADLDTIRIKQSSTFSKISEVLKISIDDLTMLNPTFNTNAIPVGDKPVYLLVPQQIALEFTKLENLIYSNNTAASNPKETKKIKSTYTVEAGEYFHKIAMKHKCTVEDIMTWNNLKTKNLLVGQKLTIWKNEEEDRFFFVKNELVK